MQSAGLAVSLIAFLLAAIILVRGFVCECLSLFPLFYSYLTYAVCGSLCMYAIYGLNRPAYSSAYWFYYLVSILVEFAVLVEISDHILQAFPAIRKLGRAVTVLISVAFAFIYILPAVLFSQGRRPALLGLALRTSVTKVVVLMALYAIAHHYRLNLGKNVGGLMLGFSIYLALNVANFAANIAFGSSAYARFCWTMVPAAYTLCLLVWTISLWNPAPAPKENPSLQVGLADAQSVALELNRFNNELLKFLNK